MKQKLSCLTLSIALLASSNWCNAANRYVSAGSDGDGLSWATAKSSIKSAVESCHTGDTVFVSSGLYNEYVSISFIQSIKKEEALPNFQSKQASSELCPLHYRY